MKPLKKIILEKSLVLEQLILEKEKGAEGVTPSQFKNDSKNDNPSDYDHVHDHAIRHLTGDISHIDSEMKNSITSYTQSSPIGYKEINAHLRGKANHPKAGRHIENVTKSIEGHPMPNSTFAYRGIRRGTAEHMRSLKPGDTFHSSGFGSTTLDPNRATHFSREGTGDENKGDIMAIHVPKGTKALYSSHPKINSWTAERELTLPHNTHYKYHGSEEIEAHTHNYEGEPTGIKKKFNLHHVEVIPHSTHSMEIDRS